MYSAPAAITTPSAPAPADQPSWNKQKGSSMPFHKYLPYREEVEEKEYDIEVKKNGTDVVVRSKVIFI